MNLAEIRDLIRAEAGVQGLDEYTTLIDAILNQELQAITGKAKYQELLTGSEQLLAASDMQNSFALPENFQLLSCAKFHESGNDPEYGVELAQGQLAGISRNIQGFPRYYHIRGRTITFYPYGSIVLGDYIQLEYYVRPVLINDTDEFPVTSLEKPVQQAVMARLLRQVDTKRAQMAKADANQSFMDSRAENAANAG